MIINYISHTHSNEQKFFFAIKYGTLGFDFRNVDWQLICRPSEL